MWFEPIFLQILWQFLQKNAASPLCGRATPEGETSFPYRAGKFFSKFLKKEVFLKKKKERKEEIFRFQKWKQLRWFPTSGKIFPNSPI